ncbi:hypothetical protein FACS189444_1580 [Spirochaetia bacterium]|nr:hypothetical protein FACS189444_1580 [Spirochaetia bacterium]
MTKKYHIFISSTLDDLKNERQELIRIIWELGHIPVTMELFDINDSEHQKIIKQNIENGDYFLSLTAHKYGPAGASRVLAEYNYARKKAVPVAALIIGEKDRWKDAKKETDPAVIQELEQFKQQLQSHPHEFWNNTAELRQKAQNLLIREMNFRPRTGWVNADQLSLPVVANELGRLSRENAELKQRIPAEGAECFSTEREKMLHTLEILALNKVSLSFFYVPGENWENITKFRCLRLFKLLAPELYVPKTTTELSRFLGSILNPALERTLRKDYPTPSNTIKKLMADLHLLKLVRFSGHGDDELWELTDYGKELYAFYRIRQFERGLNQRRAEK